MRWRITGTNLPDLWIYADCFDVALEHARLIDDGYCGGYVDNANQSKKEN